MQIDNNTSTIKFFNNNIQEPNTDIKYFSGYYEFYAINSYLMENLFSMQ